MQVIASRNHKKGQIIYHRSRCMYEKRIHPDNKWSMDLEKAQKSRDFCACKYCEGLQGEIKVHKKEIERWEKNENVVISFHGGTNAIYVKTNIGFWKFFIKDDSGKYYLYHLNKYDASMTEESLIHGEFHRQRDVKPTSSFFKLMNYIIEHDKAKIVIMDDYRKLPNKTKKQKKYYRQAESRVRRKAIRKIDKLFAKLEANNPEFKALSFC